MKRLVLVLLLVPSLAFGGFTEYYCQSGGNNVNAGSTNNNTAAYTTTNGNWNGSTGFDPTDGSTPASSISVGDHVSIYLDGATIAVAIYRVTAVAAGANGHITVVNQMGSNPTSGATGRSLKAGGAWQGPNGASGFPFTLSGLGNGTNASTDQVRVNLKNDQTYSLTASITYVTSGSALFTQGYTTTVGDGGRATFDVGANAASVLSGTGVTNNAFVDLTFSSSFATGSLSLVIDTANGLFIRCVFTGCRGSGWRNNGGGGAFPKLIECEAYGNNTSNTAGEAGFKSASSRTVMFRCISHDNTGSNTAGFTIGTSTTLNNCISESNGGRGIDIIAGGTSVTVNNCDIYNNGSDGIAISTGLASVWIENCNLVKNGGAGILAGASSAHSYGFIYNCGYGSGSMANTNADTLGSFQQSGTVTYASGATPWVDPANGDFRVSLPAANFAGRGAFLQTAPSYAGTVGYPDIGSAQSKTGPSGTFSKEVSAGYSH